MTLGSNAYCQGCGYDLTGLPKVGRCPECGQVYDLIRRRGVKDATTSEARAEQLLRRLRTIALAVLAVLLLTCAGVFHYLGRRGALAVGVFFALLLGLGAVTSYFYEKDEA